MNKLICSLCALLALLGSAYADLTLVQQLDFDGSLMQTTIKIKGDKARIELSTGSTTIVDGKTGESCTECGRVIHSWIFAP